MTVVVVGAGAVGSPAAAILGSQPEISLRILDPDTVSLSNLPRQVLYTEADLGQNKAEVLARSLGHPEWAVPAALSDANGDRWLTGADLVVDGTDNWPARKTIDTWCRRHGRPWLFLSALRWEAQAALMVPDGPCLTCLFGPGQEGPACFEVGVVGPMAGWTAGVGLELWSSYQAGAYRPVLWLLDGWTNTATRIDLTPSRCPHVDRCGQSPRPNIAQVPDVG